MAEIKAETRCPQCGEIKEIPHSFRWCEDCVKGQIAQAEEEADDRGWCDTCCNTGWLDCHCGGDLCVCENYGEYPCPDC